ncbi:MAG: RNA methyltransferase [Ruminococcus sp.]|nr:RNA methyltransferase [Ruminococcus sp.]
MKRISAKDNPLIKHINKLVKSAKYRAEQCEFVAEGVRLCEDALNSGCDIISLVVSDFACEHYSDTISKLEEKAENCYVISDSLFSKISDTRNPQGVLCVIKALDNPTLFDKIKCNGKFLALDNIQDPSNLGTILRTAEAVGVDGVILSADCCDIHSPKVVRGSMGAVFRLSYIIVDTIAAFLSEYKELTAFAAVVDSQAKKITDIDFKGKAVCAVIGNEANGLKQSTIDSCSDSFTIPMNGRAESLNASVAASIIMWEMIK